MNKSKTLFEHALFDTAFLLAILTSILYSLGMFFSLGNIDGYGISDDLAKMEFEPTITIGFFSLFFTPFMSTLLWVLSLIGLVPVLLKKNGKQVPDFLNYAGILFFIFFQVGACYDTGETMAQQEIKDINSKLSGKTVEDFDVRHISIHYQKPDHPITTIKGYALNIPGDYFVIAQKNKVVAINKNNIVSVTYTPE